MGGLWLADFTGGESQNKLGKDLSRESWLRGKLHDVNEIFQWHSIFFFFNRASISYSVYKKFNKVFQILSHFYNKNNHSFEFKFHTVFICNVLLYVFPNHFFLISSLIFFIWPCVMRDYNFVAFNHEKMLYNHNREKMKNIAILWKMCHYAT